MNENTIFCRRGVAAAVAAALSGMAGQALAIPTLTASANWTMPGPGPNAVGSETQGPSVGGSVDIIPYKDDGAGNSVFFHVYGSDSYFFGSRSSGEGTFDATGTFSLAETFTNSTGITQDYNFHFVVDFGELSVSSSGPGAVGSLASLDISILVDGSEVAAQEGKVEILGDGSVSCTASTLGIFAADPYFGCGAPGTTSYFIASKTYDMAILGIAAGASFTLDYSIVTHAVGTFGSAPGLECFGGVQEAYGGDGYGGDIRPTVGEVGGVPVDFVATQPVPCPTGSAVARTGDPLNGGPTLFSPFNTVLAGIPPGDPASGVTQVQVPVPATGLLLGLGALAMARTRKRKSPA